MRHVLRLVVLLTTLAHPAFAQIDAGSAAPPAPSTLVHAIAGAITLRAGAGGEASIQLAILPSWHINANPPSPDYMIPTLVRIVAASGITAGAAVYPAAQQLKVDFDPAPLSVYTGSATIRVLLTAAPTAGNGARTLKGTVRYQACNDQVCTTPATIPFTIEVNVTGGAAPGSTPDSASMADSTAGAAAPGATPEDSASALSGGAIPLPSTNSAALSNNPIVRGGIGAILLLFGTGLLLNLTPCVYPMLGVTVSIFGARAAAPPLKVFGSALVYMLGIVLMYTTMGVIAGLTGHLFGGILQNPAVRGGIGAFLIVMSLSMFGLFELQPPAWLLQRLGGSATTNLVGLFVSGLVVGVFAAPCIGPPIAALLAIVAERGNAWFGFCTFFPLALGLGTPYVVLGTFSNLLQKLPRSGDWMVWVKKLFGVILLSLGLSYVVGAVAPHVAAWVAPAALFIGGLYLGFIDQSAARRKGFLAFKRIAGVVAVAAAVWMVASAPRAGLEFRPYDQAAVDAALASGKPVIVDFTAEWCAACHELERKTFADPRVLSAMRGVAAFQVDLTRSESPDADARVKQFKVLGMPTVVFLKPGVGQVPAARFSGFVPPEEFLKRLRLVTTPA